MGVNNNTLGLFSLIGAVARGSSYQQPRRIDGVKGKEASGQNTTRLSFTTSALCCWNAFMLNLHFFLRAKANKYNGIME